MRILVIGGFGYLGGRIASSLVEQGHQVVLGSRREQNTPNWLPQAEVVKLVWDDETVLRSSCKNVDAVIHAAGMNAQKCVLDPAGALKVNGVDVASMVQASIASGVSKFVYLSTVHVYSSPLVGEISENTCPANRHPYAVSHIAGENAVLYQAHSIDGFTGVVLRVSNTVGAPTNKNANCWTLAVNDFCRQTVENGRIEVSSSSNVERDFLPISTLCTAINTIIDSDIDNGVINISSARAMSLQEITSIIKKRSVSTLGLLPEVHFNVKEKINISNKLVISNMKIKEIMSIEINLEDEIDFLLKKCKKWFG